MPICQENRGLVCSVIGVNKVELFSKSPTALCFLQGVVAPLIVLVAASLVGNLPSLLARCSL